MDGRVFARYRSRRLHRIRVEAAAPIAATSDRAVDESCRIAQTSLGRRPADENPARSVLDVSERS